MIVVGPVGVERHLLVDTTSRGSAAGRHGIAIRVIDERLALGGSAVFAMRGLQHNGAPAKLITNSGDSQWVSTELRQQIAHSDVADSQTGHGGEFLSIWQRDGSKQLYVRAAADPQMDRVEAAMASDPAPILGLSLSSPGSYRHLADVALSRAQQLFLVPNQTLLGSPGDFDGLLKSSTAIFLNRVEAEEAARDSGTNDIQSWYDKAAARACLVVTEAESRLSVYVSGRPPQELVLDVPKSADSISWALGGGDMFAAIAASNWGARPDLESLKQAARNAAILLKVTVPFSQRHN